MLKLRFPGSTLLVIGQYLDASTVVGCANMLVDVVRCSGRDNSGWLIQWPKFDALDSDETNSLI